MMVHFPTSGLFFIKKRLDSPQTVGVKKTVCRPFSVSLLPTISLDLIIKSASSVKEEFVPSGWNSDMTRSGAITFPLLSLNSANFQPDILRVSAMLGPRLVASYCDVLK